MKLCPHIFLKDILATRRWLNYPALTGHDDPRLAAQYHMNMIVEA